MTFTTTRLGRESVKSNNNFWRTPKPQKVNELIEGTQWVLFFILDNIYTDHNLINSTMPENFSFFYFIRLFLSLSFPSLPIDFWFIYFSDFYVIALSVYYCDYIFRTVRFFHSLSIPKQSLSTFVQHKFVVSRLFRQYLNENNSFATFIYYLL